MEKFIYRGENERFFFLAFIKSVGEENIEFPADDGTECEPESGEALGLIIVAKDYEGEWIARQKWYLGWKIVLLQDASSCVEGFSDPHWTVLEDHADSDDFSKEYIIYRSPDGEVVADTLSGSVVIAPSVDVYDAMSHEEVESLCYRREMNFAR